MFDDKAPPTAVRVPWVFVTQIPSRLDHPTGVYIPSVDVSPAREFGDLKIILPMGMNYPNAESFVGSMRKSLIDFDPSLDYLLPLGDPVVQVTAVLIVGERLPFCESLTFKLLKWDRTAARYYAYEVGP